MSIRGLYVFAFFLALPLARAEEGKVIDALESPAVFTLPKEKGTLEAVEGKDGKALKFSFADGCMNMFFMSRLRGTPDWDQAAGFSFWIKGDGSDRLGGIQFIWNEDYAARYDYAFSIKGTDWQKVVVPWRDLLPALPKPSCLYLDPKSGNAPSKLSTLWIGKWWYWRDYGAHSFVIDDLRLEAKIDLDVNEYKPAGAPLARVLEKLKAGKPVTIVTMGDSLTDYNHWANKPVNWPTLLKAKLKEKFKSEATIVNPALGGTELRQNLVLLPRWLAQTPEPDLVTVCFGYNDFNSGMTGEMFLATQKDAVDRIRRATKGKADVLLITTLPAVEKWTELGVLAEAVRKAAQEKSAGLADAYAAFHEAGKENKERLYCNDKTHLGPVGHELLANVVVTALEKAGK